MYCLFYETRFHNAEPRFYNAKLEHLHFFLFRIIINSDNKIVCILET